MRKKARKTTRRKAAPEVKVSDWDMDGCGDNGWDAIDVISTVGLPPPRSSVEEAFSLPEFEKRLVWCEIMCYLFLLLFILIGVGWFYG